MVSPLSSASCARLPAARLAGLGALRARPGVRILHRSDVLWVFWPAGDESTAALLQALDGVELFCDRLGGEESSRHPPGAVADGTRSVPATLGRWYRPGYALPTFEVPDPSAPEGTSLAGLLSPQPVVPTAPGPRSWPPARLTLVPDERGPRPASALRCLLDSLDAWADTATSDQLAVLQAAWHDADQGEVLVVGSPLPAVLAAGGVGARYWGREVLVPLGRRPEPSVEETVLREALHAGADELVLVEESGIELIPRSALGPVTRAGVRVAVRGPRP